MFTPADGSAASAAALAAFGFLANVTERVPQGTVLTPTTIGSDDAFLAQLTADGTEIG